MIKSRGFATDATGYAAKPPTKPVPSKRRALGDITNALNDEEPKNQGQVKKQTAGIKISSSEPMIVNEEQTLPSDRVYMQRPCDDIDGRDEENPLLVTCYVNELYDHFNAIERQYQVHPAYMGNQDFVNEKMRSILVDWLVEVHLKFKMVPESLYMTTSIIDRYLQKKQVRRSKLQLVGVAALLIAAKYEEIYPPELKELVYITDRAYTSKEILDMESDIANALNFEFTVPTIHTFLCRFLKAAHADRTMVQLACYLTERTLQEYTLLGFLPSQIAAAAVCVTRKTLKRHPWSPTLMKYTNMDEGDLQACMLEMKNTFTNPANQQQAVQRKYSSSKFGGVAKMPLTFF